MKVTLLKRQDYDGIWYVVRHGANCEFFRNQDKAEEFYQNVLQTEIKETILKEVEL